jgi:AbrB family looped-hinge helix DNA binding protein
MKQNPAKGGEDVARKNESIPLDKAIDMGCCKVESLVSVDERGQMVLPKELREKAKIRTGEKLALISWEKDGEVCCVSLIKAQDLMGMVKGLLGPMMKDLAADRNQ